MWHTYAENVLDYQSHNNICVVKTEEGKESYEELREDLYCRFIRFG